MIVFKYFRPAESLAEDLRCIIANVNDCSQSDNE